MTARREVSLGTAQETLLIPLYGRAMEDRKPEAALRDARAEEIVYDFARFDGLPSLVGSVLRTSLFDQRVSDLLTRHPESTVVELGAGLNTRYERIDNGRAAAWSDAVRAGVAIEAAGGTTVTALGLAAEPGTGGDSAHRRAISGRPPLASAGGGYNRAAGQGSPILPVAVSRSSAESVIGVQARQARNAHHHESIRSKIGTILGPAFRSLSRSEQFSLVKQHLSCVPPTDEEPAGRLLPYPWQSLSVSTGAPQWDWPIPRSSCNAGQFWENLGSPSSSGEHVGNRLHNRARA
ncbi:hypothetical protein AB0D14_35485 [Streptomyces sp. NPDC048484]|uniref:hypothetical protein n=1 Tax=Streptomyces sp. NPDC048484 TaxID=3155146 RepID=UPI003430366C